MWQRKQTVFLVFALVLTVVCMSLPLGVIEPKLMGAGVPVYNLGISGIQASGYVGWIPFVILLATCLLDVAAIACYKSRKTQMRLCNGCIALNAAWYAYFIYGLLSTFSEMGGFSMNWTLCIPLVSIILYAMAHSGIKKDDELVRSMDRIR